jgi:hypothetical protein
MLITLTSSAEQAVWVKALGSPQTHAVSQGAIMPLRRVLPHDHSFTPDDVEILSAAYDAAIKRLGLVDHSDPLTLTVAKLIIELAKQGEGDPAKLAAAAVTSLRGKSSTV